MKMVRLVGNECLQKAIDVFGPRQVMKIIQYEDKPLRNRRHHLVDQGPHHLDGVIHQRAGRPQHTARLCTKTGKTLRQTGD